jgi:hypothetical protein
MLGPVVANQSLVLFIGFTLCVYMSSMNGLFFLKKNKVMLTCALKAHVKVPKNRNLIFNNTKSLIRKKYNTSQIQ